MPKWNEADQVFYGSQQVTGVRHGANPPAWAPYNSAAGGTEATVSNYNGTGETWKVHTFTPSTADKNFVVLSSRRRDFRVLVVAGGGGSGGGKDGGDGSGGGAAGQAFMFDDQEISANTYALSVGAGGSATGRTGYNQPSIGGTGGTSAFPGIGSASGGAGGGNSGSGGYNNWGAVYRPPATPGTPISSNITGSNQTYSQGEGGTVPGSGAAAEVKPGKDGLVIIAYRIG